MTINDEQNEQTSNYNCSFYGVIDRFEEEKCYARIYELDTHDYFDDISFNKDEFTEEDIKDLVENAIFLWDVGCKEDKHYSVFKLKRTKI